MVEVTSMHYHAHRTHARDIQDLKHKNGVHHVISQCNATSHEKWYKNEKDLKKNKNQTQDEKHTECRNTQRVQQQIYVTNFFCSKFHPQLFRPTV